MEPGAKNIPYSVVLIPSSGGGPDLNLPSPSRSSIALQREAASHAARDRHPSRWVTMPGSPCWGSWEGTARGGSPVSTRTGTQIAATAGTRPRDGDFTQSQTLDPCSVERSRGLAGWPCVSRRVCWAICSAHLCRVRAVYKGWGLALRGARGRGRKART